MSREKEDRMPHSELHRKALLVAVTCALFASPFAAQDVLPPGSAPSFDVATIKPHEGMISVSGLMNKPDGISAPAVTLSDMIVSAYGVRSDDQVSGGSDWVKSDRYDVEAKLSAEDAAAFQKLSPEEMKARRMQMLRSLLADRFKLQAHVVTKDVPVYELVVAKGGPKMKDAATDKDEHLRMGKDGKPLAGVMWFLNDHLAAQGYSMGSLASLFSQPFSALGRPVVDKTGLTGSYDFTLNWSPQMKSVLPGAVTAAAPPEDAPSIFTALQELGLKLQPATGPEKMVVIDHVERPSQN
ncbi:MAG TPA: TIGR03435 family protein [Acidobacteriaceae bacterium]|nr:TIGR03435 family protein [Acidobacteriaceae bacterium]